MFKVGEDQNPESRLVIIQCDSGHLYGDLIACARYRIYDLRARADEEQTTHVLFIIHLPQQTTSSFVGFQGDPWISVHIDDLRHPSDIVVPTKEAISTTISELFLGQLSPEVIEFIIEKQASASGRDNIIEDVLSESDDDEFFDAQEYWPEDANSGDEIQGGDNETDEHFEDSQAYQVAPKPVDEEMITTKEHTAVKNQEEEKNKEASDSLFIPTNPTAASSSLHMVETPYENFLSQRSPLFKRLRSCIQAAASRLKDSSTRRSTRRVAILINLIPKDLPDLPGLRYLYFWFV